MKQKHTILCVFSFLISMWAMSVSAYETNRGYEIRIRNLTQGQTLTPVLVVLHKPGTTLFNLGEAASEQLAMLAEGGNTGPLSELLEENPGVGHIAST